MLTEMARMSLEDGLVMQIHPGVVPQPQSAGCSRRYGRDKGADIPSPTEYVHALKPLLDRFGNERGSVASSCSRSMRPRYSASWRRWPVTIRC